MILNTEAAGYCPEVALFCNGNRREELILLHSDSFIPDAKQFGSKEGLLTIANIAPV
jgi:hypothetical protein